MILKKAYSVNKTMGVIPGWVCSTKGVLSPSHRSLTLFAADKSSQPVEKTVEVEKNIYKKSYYYQYLLYRGSKPSLETSSDFGQKAPPRRGGAEGQEFGETSSSLKGGLSVRDFYSTWSKKEISPWKKKTFGGPEGSFFPYRKSFLCYWLLPFVGFVYTVEQPFRDSLTKLSNPEIGVYQYMKQQPGYTLDGAPAGQNKKELFLDSFYNPTVNHPHYEVLNISGARKNNNNLTGLSYLSSLENYLASYNPNNGKTGDLSVLLGKLESERKSSSILNSLANPFSGPFLSGMVSSNPTSGQLLVSGEKSEALLQKGREASKTVFKMFWYQLPSKGTTAPLTSLSKKDWRGAFGPPKENVLAPLWGGDLSGPNGLKAGLVNTLVKKPNLHFHSLISLYPSPYFSNTDKLGFYSSKEESTGYAWLGGPSAPLPKAKGEQGSFGPVFSFRKASALLDMYSKTVMKSDNAFYLSTAEQLNQSTQNKITKSDGEKTMNSFSPSLYEKFFSLYENFFSSSSKTISGVSGAEGPASKDKKLDPYRRGMDGIVDKNSFQYVFLLEGLSEKNQSVQMEGSNSSYSKLPKSVLYRLLSSSFTSPENMAEGHDKMEDSSTFQISSISTPSLGVGNKKRELLKYSHPILMSIPPYVENNGLPASGNSGPPVGNTPSKGLVGPSAPRHRLETSHGLNGVSLEGARQSSSESLREKGTQWVNALPLGEGKQSSIGLYENQLFLSSNLKGKINKHNQETLNHFSSFSKFVSFYESKVKERIISSVLGPEGGVIRTYAPKGGFNQNVGRGAEGPTNPLGLNPLVLKGPHGASYNKKSVSKIEKLLRAFFSIKNPSAGLQASPRLKPSSSFAYKSLKKKMSLQMVKNLTIKQRKVAEESPNKSEGGILLNYLSHANGKRQQKSVNTNSSLFILLNTPVRKGEMGSRIEGSKSKRKLQLVSSTKPLLSSMYEGLVGPKAGLWPQLSPRLLLKNRFFIFKKAPVFLSGSGSVGNQQTLPFLDAVGPFGENVSSDNMFGVNSVSIKEKDSNYFDLTKYNQKKRRIKKLKKETRRRKKRKRFYPRPVGLRYRLYKKILKNRYYLPQKEFSLSSSRNVEKNLVPNALSLKKNGNNYYTYMNQSPSKGDMDVFTLWGMNNNPYISLNARRDFYTISPAVRREGKRLLWKSYWLRSNLTPYLNKVESSLTEIENSTKSWDLYNNVRNFVTYFLGLNYENPGLSPHGNSGKEGLVGPSAPRHALLSSLPNGSTGGYGDNTFKWGTALYLAEYNRVSYSRIQSFISKIRENLTLNGGVKPHGAQMSPLISSINAATKRSSAKESGSFLGLSPVKVEKILNLLNRTPGSSVTFPPFGGGEYGLYWAFSKSRYGMQSEYNKNEKLWTATKIREQTKNNKTKKIYKDIQSRINSFLNSRSFVMNTREGNIPLWAGSSLNGNINPLGDPYKNRQSFLSSDVTSPGEDVVKDSFTLGNENVVKLLENALRKTRLTEAKSKILGFPKITTESKNVGLVGPKAPRHSEPTYSYSKLTSKSSFWWSGPLSFNTFLSSERNETAFPSGPHSITKTGNSLSRVWVSALLFHFCTIISILSISQIRGLLKFYLLAIGKIYKTFLQILGLAFDSISRIKLFQQTSPPRRGLSMSLSGLKEAPEGLVGPKAPRQVPLSEGSLNTVGSRFSKGQVSSSQKVISMTGVNGKRMSNLNNAISLTSLTSGSLARALPSSAISYDLGLRNFYTFTQIVGRMSNQMSTRMTEPEENISVETKKPNGNFVVKRLYLLVWSIIVKLTYSMKKGEKRAFGQKPTSAASNAPSGQKGSLSPLAFVKTYTMLNSLVIMNSLVEKGNTLYRGTASLLKEAKEVLFLSSLRSIYSFLEKPGELIVDWIAYLFLVEWASDITNTIPENLDLAVGTTSYKMTRNLYYLNALNMLSLANNGNMLLPSLGANGAEGQGNSHSMLGSLSFFNIGSTFIQRRIYHLYEILLLQFYGPDTDLIVRQKKGIIFWDIWGDFLIQVAEEGNINISELTSLKEEQIKLLEKCEMYNSASDGLGMNAILMPRLNERKNKENLESTSASDKTYPVLGEESFDSASYSNILSFRKNVKSLMGPLSSFGRVNQNPKPFMSEGLNPSVKLFGEESFFLYQTSLLLNKESASGGSGHAWGAQQFLSYQGKDTELFIDLHPRGALEGVSSLKSNSSIIQPIGSLVCQIFSGLLTKQISKNMLIVGSYNNRIEKTLLVQAVAGETELKIVVDSAYRYAMVYRGVAVGIKLLRDVFDSLVATGPPCLFLISDIHAIGERRPMLISDDENSLKEGIFGAKGEESGEKNQVLYQLSKHMITHYKKPYKGDFSLLIPTNHFSFSFFLGVTSREGNNIYPPRKSPVSPPISYKNEKEGSSEFSRKMAEIGGTGGDSSQRENRGTEKPFSSRLLIKTSELLAPPATSPFSVLTLKEEKKFRPTKLVSEMPWAGLPGEQYANLISNKEKYSIRVKIALLADMAISSLSVKLDMITDLLVIIDSVKGNRGFVVFATTHVPYTLDPALRRPGRFDETLSLGIFPTVFSRWEVLKSSFSTLNPGVSPFPQGLGANSGSYGLSVDFSLYLKNSFSFLSGESQLGNHQNMYLSPFNIMQKRRQLFKDISSVITSQNQTEKLPGEFNTGARTGSVSLSLSSRKNRKNHHLEFALHNTPGGLPTRAVTKLLSQTYYLASQGLFRTLPLRGQNETLSGHLLSTSGKEGLLDLTPELLHENSRFISFYSSPQIFKNHCLSLIVGKVGEMFILRKNSSLPTDVGAFISTLSQANSNPSYYNILSKERATAGGPKALLAEGGPTGIYSTFGLENTIGSLTSLILSFINKRFIYHKNLMIPQLLEFRNYSPLLSPSSPPSSSILLPAKRYENYRRSLAFFTQKRKTESRILEKINLHQQQRLVKRLYRFPVKEFFRSEIAERSLTGFSNAALMIGSYEAILQKPSSSNWFVRNRLFMRHQNYLTNQWWNGGLPEHNAETTYLSDIDWRYTFIESIGDLLFDFPDADQHYSPRNRRWLLTKGSYDNMFSFDKTIQAEIYSHFIFSSFIKAFHLFEQNRETLDFYAFYILKKGLKNGLLHSPRTTLN